MAGNSWQQPVAGEPSCGTLHFVASPTDANVYTNTTPTAGTWYTVTFTGIPAGTKAVIAFVYGADSAAAGYMFYRPYGSASADKMVPHRIVLCGGGAQAILPVDSSGRVDIAVGAGTTDIYIAHACAYFI